MRLATAAVLLALAPPAALAAPMAAPKPSPAITGALASPTRPAADKERDAARKPGELLALAGVKPGDKVADFIMGGGYFTRIFSGVVGPQGRVYAYQPAEFISFNPKYATDQDAAVKDRANVKPTRVPLSKVAFAEPLDVIFTAQNYHDFHLKQVPAGSAAFINKQMFASLKPGGVLLIVDHSAADGSGLRDADTLHRIDQAAVVEEVTAAGFKLEAESDLLRNPADPRTALVFLPEIRGKTDQFVLKFRKPE